MKKILITIITEDDKFETSSFMNDFISFKSSESAKEYHIKDLYYEEKICFELTEDERVILRNIKDHPKYIARQKGYGLMAYDEAKRDGKTGWSYDNGSALSSFNHLFQFIKERRRI